MAQAYYNAEEGIKRLTTETGAGQWGSALAFAGALFGLEVIVYMVKVSYEQKPYRRALMETWGAKVRASPTDRTELGRSMLAQDPDSPGSLGIAISEAVEDAATREDTHYSLGSVVNHVLLHQTVIGLEAKNQMEMADAYPDVVIGCVGGGSNFAGLAYPFLADRIGRQPEDALHRRRARRLPDPDAGHLRLRLRRHRGHGPGRADVHPRATTSSPTRIHAGGLRYHGDAPSLCLLVKHGLVEARAYKQNECFAEAVRFARSEGILPGARAVARASGRRRGGRGRARGRRRARSSCSTSRGTATSTWRPTTRTSPGQLEDVELPQERLDAALAELPKVPAGAA